MKAFKTVTMAAALIGIMLIVSAFGADDFYVMQHAQHTLAWDLIIYGVILCMPMLIVGDRND